MRPQEIGFLSPEFWLQPQGTDTLRIGLLARLAMGRGSSHADPEGKTDAVTPIEEACHVAGGHRITYLATRDRGGKREGRLGEDHGRDAYRRRADESRAARRHH